MIDLDNVIGGFWLLDLVVSWICLVGTRTFGNNRVEPDPILHTSGFVLIGGVTPKESKPLDKKDFYSIPK